MFFSCPVFAVDSGTVSVTIPTEIIALELSTTAVFYPSVGFAEEDIIPSSDPAITVFNIGTVSEDFKLRGADASFTGGDASWTLISDAANLGEDQYRHKYGVIPDPNDDPTTLTPLPGSDDAPAVLATGVPTAGGDNTRSFKLRLDSPPKFTAYGEYTTTVTVVAEMAD